MNPWRKLTRAVRALIQKHELDADMEAELLSHVEMRTQQHIADGMPPEEARYAALRQFGWRESIKEDCREQRGVRWLETLLQDIRFGARMLRKNPGFTAVAVLTLALGIGANTAIFSVVDTVLIRPLPYRDAEQLFDLAEVTALGERNYVSGGAFKDWAEHCTLLADIALYNSITLNLTGSGTPERVAGLEVTSRYLPLLGIQPTVGNGFVADSDTLGGNNKVIVLANNFWRAHFGGDPTLVGRTISLDQVPHTIIGVLPPNALLDKDAQFLVPAVIDGDRRWGRSNGNWWARVIGRAKPGVTLKQVEGQLKSIRERLAAEYPAKAKDMGVAAAPFQETITSEVRPTFILLLCAASFVLLIACANVANLLLARGHARARELAIRSALGAHPTRLMRQMLTESGLLALAGCTAGIVLAIFAIDLLPWMISDFLPNAPRPKLDARIFVFSVLTTCACALMFGLLPALRACRPDPNRELKETDRGSTSSSLSRSQSMLIVSEVAFTIVLLVGSGLSIRGFAKLRSTDLGFDPRGTLAFNLSFPTAKYSDVQARKRFMQELETRLGGLPGIQFAGFSSALPLSGEGDVEPLTRPGRPTDRTYFAGADMVSKDFFGATGTPVLRGRSLTEGDVANDPPKVCLISQGIVRDLFPGEDPIGQQVVFWGLTIEVVGVVANVYHEFGGPRSTMYLPGLFPNQRHVGVAIRTSVNPLTLVKAVRDVLTRMDPDLPMANVRTFDQALYGALSRWRATLILLATFAFIAISLACIGLYGVISYSVSQRHREFGIRMALGAGRGSILQLVLVRGLVLTLAGTVIGTAVALGVGGLFSSQVFGIAPRDLTVTICSVFVMFIVALLAAYVPARRATGLNPVAALRND